MSDPKGHRDSAGIDLEHEYVILERDEGARTIRGGAAFWEALMGGQLPDVERGRLVTLFAFDGAWATWEIHPNGEELGVLIEGAVEFVLEEDGAQRSVTLEHTGSAIVIPRGTWHTARTKQPTRVLFVTAGRGTEHRPASRRE